MGINISEIFSSVQGEGKYTGFPTTFIRFYKCNLHCNYCDTPESNSKNGKRREIGIEGILATVNRLKNPYICITGGEPLLQGEAYPLIYELVSKGYIISIETNGSIEIPKDHYNRSFNYCMDIKCPSSGMSGKNKYSNLGNLLAKDEVKFVISDFTDFLFAKSVIKQYHTVAQIIFSPCFDKAGISNAKELAGWIEEDKIPNVRLGVQIHKVIDVK